MSRRIKIENLSVSEINKKLAFITQLAQSGVGTAKLNEKNTFIEDIEVKKPIDSVSQYSASVYAVDLRPDKAAFLGNYTSGVAGVDISSFGPEWTVPFYRDKQEIAFYGGDALFSHYGQGTPKMIFSLGQPNVAANIMLEISATGVKPKVANYADDAAAAAGGVAVGEMYHTSGTVKIRLV